MKGRMCDAGVLVVYESRALVSFFRVEQLDREDGQTRANEARSLTLALALALVSHQPASRCIEREQTHAGLDSRQSGVCSHTQTVAEGDARRQPK